jgi:DNA-binding XRE family transcriptional regulator
MIAEIRVTTAIDATGSVEALDAAREPRLSVAALSLPPIAALAPCPHASDPRPCKGLSRDDLAYEAEVSRTTLSQLEKGAFHVSLKIIGKLAKVLEVEPAELLRLPARKRGRSG